MKKIFIALSFLAALAFTASPSMALVGTPDAVPGTHVLQPFFLVSFDGKLNTLTTITEVKGVRSSVHWTVWTQKSEHAGNGTLPYTPFDVISIDVKYMLENWCSGAGLTALEVDLDNDGVNDHWMGYITYENAWAWQPGIDNFPGFTRDLTTYDNLIGHMYLINLGEGLASGVTIPARELAYRGIPGFDPNRPGLPGWWLPQNSYLDTTWLPPVGQLPMPRFTDYETFTAFSYATSKARENGFIPLFQTPMTILPVPQYFRLLPRYFLLNDASDTFFFIWSSGNWGTWEQGGMFDPDIYTVPVDIFDEDEHKFSVQINIPYELNFVNIKPILPGSWNPPIGGWVDIRWDFLYENLPFLFQDANDDWISEYPWAYSAVPMGSEWLAYSYQYAQSATSSTNWGTLFEVHRDVGTLINALGLDL